jgi:hypothetical protein
MAIASFARAAAEAMNRAGPMIFSALTSLNIKTTAH